MRYLLFALFPLLLSFASDTIRFTPLPMETVAKTYEIFTPFTKFLEQKIGKKVEIVYIAKNAEIMEALKEGKIDIAHLGPLPYVKLHEAYKDMLPIIQFLEKDGSPLYTCTLFRRKNSTLDYTKAKDLSFALTFKYSTCGYASVEELLREHGTSLLNNSFHYSFSHYRAIADVVNGDYDFGTVKTSIYEQFKYLDIEPVAEGKPNPELMLVANTKTLTSNEIESIQKSILESTPEERKSWVEKIHDPVAPDIESISEYEKRIEGIQLLDER